MEGFVPLPTLPLVEALRGVVLRRLQLQSLGLRLDREPLGAVQQGGGDARPLASGTTNRSLSIQTRFAETEENDG